MSSIRSKLDRDHVRLPTLASGRAKLQEALVDHHTQPLSKVDRGVFGALGVHAQTCQYRRRPSPASPAPTF